MNRVLCYTTPAGIIVPVTHAPASFPGLPSFDHLQYAKTEHTAKSSKLEAEWPGNKVTLRAPVVITEPQVEPPPCEYQRNVNHGDKQA